VHKEIIRKIPAIFTREIHRFILHDKRKHQKEDNNDPKADEDFPHNARAMKIGPGFR